MHGIGDLFLLDPGHIYLGRKYCNLITALAHIFDTQSASYFLYS